MMKHMPMAPPAQTSTYAFLGALALLLIATFAGYLLGGFWLAAMAVGVMLVGIFSLKRIVSPPEQGHTKTRLATLTLFSGVTLAILKSGSPLSVLTRLFGKPAAEHPSGIAFVQLAIICSVGAVLVILNFLWERRSTLRLQSDHVAPPQPTVTALHQLPSPPRDFTGRTAELDELMTAFAQGGVTICGLQGMGGIGKTSMALTLAAQLAPRYPDAQFYLDLKGTSPHPLSAAEAMAHVIHAYHPNMDLPQGEAELSGLYQTVLQGKQALLLMDNAANKAQVEPLVPPSSCGLLLTSRQHFLLPGLFAKQLETLPPADARTLLLTIAPRIRAHADALAQLCGYLPLALRVVAGTLAGQSALHPANYVRRLADTQQRLQLTEVDASLNVSFELLSPELRQQWCALAVFPDTFDRPAVAAVWALESDLTEDALHTLITYSLVEWNPATDRYRLHDLVRLFADAKLSDVARTTAQTRHAMHYCDVLVEAERLYLKGGDASLAGLTSFDLEWTNMQAGQAWTAAQAEQDKTAEMLCARYPNAGANLLSLRRSPLQRLEWLQPAVAAAHRLQNPVEEGAVLGNLGNVYAEIGNWPAAIRCHEANVALARAASDGPAEAIALVSLADAHQASGSPEGVCRAVQLYEQAMTMVPESGDHSRRKAVILLNLGTLYAHEGAFPDAIDHGQQALTIFQEIQDLHGESLALYNIGRWLNNTSERAEAIRCVTSALTIFDRIGDEAMADRARTLLQLWDTI